MTTKKTIAILGSSRSHGNTREALERVLEGQSITIVDLNDLNMAYFRYDLQYEKDDDFIKTAENLINFDQIIFATPVYWYSMSAILKTFFDRLTDLLHSREDLLQKLEGSTLFLLTSSSEKELPPGFEMPFSLSAEYLKMDYGGALHTWQEKGVLAPQLKEDLQQFKQRLGFTI